MTEQAVTRTRVEQPDAWASKRTQNTGRPVATPRISVIIPALNEERNLPYVLTRLPRDIYEVIVVDGGSSDRTVDVSRRLCPEAKIVRQSGKGKGNALGCGFAASSGDIIVMLDADGSADAAEIPRFVAALSHGADFAKGSRFISGGGSADITHLRALGNKALNRLVNSLFRTRYTDLCYGYNAFWAHCLPYMDVDCDGFEVETLINIRVAKARLEVHEVASFEGARIHGVSNLHAVRDGTRVLKTILAERLKKNTVRNDHILPPVLLGHGWDGVERRTGLQRRIRSWSADYVTEDGERRRSEGRRASDRRAAWYPSSTSRLIASKSA